jgi:hypothetical protein
LGTLNFEVPVFLHIPEFFNSSSFPHFQDYCSSNIGLCNAAYICNCFSGNLSYCGDESLIFIFPYAEKCQELPLKPSVHKSVVRFYGFHVLVLNGTELCLQMGSEMRRKVVNDSILMGNGENTQNKTRAVDRLVRPLQDETAPPDSVIALSEEFGQQQVQRVFGKKS